jgi:4-diphosphocytidyl-2-C-methyl-D-erythritol kinase
MVNKLYDLNLSNEKLEEHAATLGSDCPFFIQNRAMYVTGKGEKMQPLDLKLNGFYMVLVYPGFHVSTKWAYSKIVPKPVEADMLMVIKQDFPQWKKHLKNDFQPLVIKERDYLLRVIELLNNNGSMYTAMTGSGSTVYGIFSEFPEGIQFHPEDTHVTLPL